MTTPAWQARAETVIADNIRGRTTVTYAELAAVAGVPPPHRINKLTAWLEETMERDHALGLPPRAAVVVSRTDGLPARGFFEKLGELGGVAATAAGDRGGLHASLLEELRAS